MLPRLAILHMISTTPAENDQFSLESQNLPRCMHSEIISQFILDAVDGKQINIDKLTNTVNQNTIIHSLLYFLAQFLPRGSCLIRSFHR